MTATTNEHVFREMIEQAFNRGDVASLGRYFAPGFVEHQDGVEAGGPDGLKGLILNLRSAFPDAVWSVEDSAADGDKVWFRLRCRGTQSGPFMGLPPTGRAFDTTAFELCRFRDGKIVEHWGVPDRLAMLQQVGLFPPRREAVAPPHA